VARAVPPPRGGPFRSLRENRERFAGVKITPLRIGIVSSGAFAALGGFMVSGAADNSGSVFSEPAAAWAQAFGTVAAIGAALFATFWQVNRARQEAIEREVSAVRAVKRQVLVLGGIAWDRIDRINTSMGLSGPRTWAELTLLRGMADNDLRALWAFHPQTDDVEMLQRYLTARGILAAVYDQLGVARDEHLRGRSPEIIHAELAPQIVGLRLESLKALKELQSHLGVVS